MKNKPYFLQEACNLVYPQFLLVKNNTTNSCLFQVAGTGTLLVTYVIASEEVQNTYQMNETATTIQVPAESTQINLVGDITSFQSISNVYVLVADKSSIEYIATTQTMESMSITRCHALSSIYGGLNPVIGQLSLKENKTLNSVYITSGASIIIENCPNLAGVILGTVEHAAPTPTITISGKTSINIITYAGNNVGDYTKLKEAIIALIESSTVESGYVDCTELNSASVNVAELQEIVTTYGWTIDIA